ncbi:12351_t:CDS:2, partial [Entrophospora sp. SA101]
IKLSKEIEEIDDVKEIDDAKEIDDVKEFDDAEDDVEEIDDVEDDDEEINDDEEEYENGEKYEEERKEKANIKLKLNNIKTTISASQKQHLKKIVREISLGIRPGLRFRSDALDELQKLIETRLRYMLRDAGLSAKHAGRDIIKVEDLIFASHFRERVTIE